jgi:putative Mg2+ transporter-C (MgtC) family protein
MEIFTQEFIPFLQIIVAMILGSLLGTERTFAGKTAGMRTYGLVAMGSALLIVSSTIIDKTFIGITNFDPMRLAAGIVTGIGFIGAGLIIFRENKLEGLTTAAGLWVACGIGIAVGFELWGLAFFATFLTLFNFTILWYVEHHVKKKFRRGNLQDLHNEDH